MLVLPRFIVSLRPTNIRLICEWLSKDNLVAEVREDSFGLVETCDYLRKSYVVYNVRTGMLTECTQSQYDSLNQFCENSFIEWCATFVEGCSRQEAFDVAERYFNDHPSQRTKWETDYRRTVLGERVATLDQCRLLQALVSHQVAGDDLVKGLKAEGFTLQGKVINNYLGGWTFSYPDVESLIGDLKRREE